MSDFRKLTDTVFASPQITPAEVEEAARQGFTMIVNNRPDGEEPDQPDSASIESAALQAGLDYRAIPISGGAFGMSDVDEMARALAEASGPVLAFCRSGTRSTFLWSLAQAKAGLAPDEIAGIASGAGYDVSPIRPTLETLARQADG